jgi:hypothetical protein
MGRIAMLLIGGALVALAIVGQTTEAWARCPAGTSYQCHQGMNGKVICGCR